MQVLVLAVIILFVLLVGFVVTSVIYISKAYETDDPGNDQIPDLLSIIHSSFSFNANKDPAYIVRDVQIISNHEGPVYELLTVAQIADIAKTRPSMKLSTKFMIQQIQVRVTYGDNISRVVTVPKTALFNGDSLKLLIKTYLKSLPTQLSTSWLDDWGIAWCIHDHLYRVQMWDDGTAIPRKARWMVDDIMFHLLEKDPEYTHGAHKIYAAILRGFEAGGQSQYFSRWDMHAADNLRIPIRKTIGGGWIKDI
jgi:hypothetical protein